MVADQYIGLPTIHRTLIQIYIEQLHLHLLYTDNYTLTTIRFRNKPGMVGPTIGLLSFYWVIATLNLLGLFVLRANFLCQTICEYDLFNSIVDSLFYLMCV